MTVSTFEIGKDIFSKTTGFLTNNYVVDK